ncbi:MAG: multi-sensor signal transduction histidine kinase [Sphingomonas bacterium]|nr:XrtA/PEP-CTERM system histidine kinase PrsK [Sphingomonas bacterium]MDB5689038.1 multi-sensor signal transduction histidine kinase [Sphingomonas bacterium]
MTAPVDTIQAIGLWSHGTAAILFVLLALWQMASGRGGVQRRLLALAFGLTALWAAVVAWGGGEALAARFAECGRNIGWLGVMLALLTRGGEGDRRRPATLALYAVLMSVIVAQAAVEVAPGDYAEVPAYMLAALMLRMTVAIGALVLVHNLYTAAAPDARWGIRLPMLCLAAMWAYDLNIFTVAYLGHSWPTELVAVRGVVMTLLVPLFAMAGWRNLKWKMRVSRAVAFQSLSLVAIGGYLIFMVIAAQAVQMLGGGSVGLAQITVVAGLTAAAIALLPSVRLRAWLRVKIAKHFFQHRYDYRVEWMRFTETLGVPGEDAAPLDVRVVQAIADITESPGGLLLLPADDGGLSTGSRWNWATLNAPAVAAGHAFAQACAETGRIVELDSLRRDPAGNREEAAVLPDWLLAEASAWVAVPLVHIDRLVGVVVLERPVLNRVLDWEDFDLLRIAGRQVASYLAEARGQEALSEARRFDEFNRRFAFVVHDIKNLVSQLSLVSRNAQRHADNPEFRADMIATLQDSVSKMNELLARLSQHHKGKAEEPRPVALRALAEDVAAARPATSKVQVVGRQDIVARADPARLVQALGHLVQNAVDASPRGTPVQLRVVERNGEAAIEVIDQGVGMSPDFVRTRLFKPFASTKEGGFGVGAFEARSIVAGMGGRLEVESREGAGTRFAIVLPIAHAAAPLLARPGASRTPDRISA